MEVYPSIGHFSPVSDTVFALGVFDGVHAGHRRLIARLNEKAKETRSTSVLLSFDPHPREVLQSDLGLKYLTTRDEKIHLLESIGLQRLILHPFAKAFAALRSEDFVRDFLLNRLRMRYMIVGHDHCIGKDKEGNYQQLSQFAKVYRFGLEQLPVYRIGPQVVSSTAIRKALLAGDLSWATHALGAPYMISGRVVRGDRLGRDLGFPTANIQVAPKKLLPRKGVYAVRVDLRGQEHIGMLNIGVRPTVGGLNMRVEVHLLDFCEMIYDEMVYISLIQRVRDEQKFDTLEDLKVQLQQDESLVRAIFVAE